MLGTNKEHNVFFTLDIYIDTLCIYAFRISHAWKNSELLKIWGLGLKILDFTKKKRYLNYALNINSQKKKYEFRVLKNTLTSEVGFPSWWCSSFDLWYRSITDFMLVKSIQIVSDMHYLLFITYFTKKGSYMFSRITMWRTCTIKI